MCIISKTKDFLWKMLEHFEKKDEYPSLIISEIMDCEISGYLNVLKVLLQKTMR